MLRRRRRRASYTLDEIGPLLSIGHHQLRGLLERRVIAPSVTRGHRGPGGKRRFDDSDLVAIRSSHELVRLGVVGERLRRANRAIRRLARRGGPRALLLITPTGEALHLARTRNLSRLVQRAGGPYGHVVLDLGRIAQDVSRLLKRQHARGLLNVVVAAMLSLSSWASSDSICAAAVSLDISSPLAWCF